MKKTRRDSIGCALHLDRKAMKSEWARIAAARWRPKLPSALMRGTRPIVVIPPAKPAV
jgi:hypothetical protein